jgi:hypothetical protein
MFTAGEIQPPADTPSSGTPLSSEYHDPATASISASSQLTIGRKETEMSVSQSNSDIDSTETRQTAIRIRVNWNALGSGSLSVPGNFSRRNTKHIRVRMVAVS